MRIITAVVAIAKNNVIGVNNTIPWKCPEDMRWFKRVTTANSKAPLVMGSSTWLSVNKYLKGREIMVMSRDPDLMLEKHGIKTYQSVESVLSATNEDLVICGGAEIYALFSDLLDWSYVTELDLEIETENKSKVAKLNSWWEVDHIKRTLHSFVSNDVPGVINLYHNKNFALDESRIVIPEVKTE